MLAQSTELFTVFIVLRGVHAHTTVFEVVGVGDHQGKFNKFQQVQRLGRR
jgi:hypothetical protein